MSVHVKLTGARVYNRQQD